MSTRRALTRSPSPSVLFASSLPASETSKATRRSKATAPASGIANGGHGKNSQLHDVGEDVNGETEPNASEEVDKKGIIPEKKKIDWEIPRKLLHSSIGASCSHFGVPSIISLLSFAGFLVIPLYTSHTSPRRVVQVLSVAGAVISSVDYVRLRSPRFAVIYEKFLGFLMRESEKVCLQHSEGHRHLKCVTLQHKTNGVIWYLLGCVFVLSIYPLDIAVISILMCVLLCSLFCLISNISW